MKLSREDRWLLSWLAAALLAAFLLMAVNALFFHYTGISYFPRECWWLAFVAVDLAIFGHWIRERSPRASFAAIGLAFYALAMAVTTGVLVSAVQYTPFPRIDHALARWDAALGWDTVAVLSWIAERPRLRTFLNWCYNSTDLQLALAPFVPALAGDRRRMRVLLYALTYSTIAGSLFYYFFPSSGPASVFQSPDFLQVQRFTHMKYEQVHQFRPVTTLLGGLIAFPSFHVAWSVLVTYAALPNKNLFRAAAVLNTIVIASTVLLAWHYVVDVPAGIALAWIGLWAGEATHRRVGS
ncbi:MAG: phosphatase PAP2 family protein [Elusimicrobia bacterium]|nr:phosphatase PAP2 family protein [Elusimicrobiota bacterium]